jgi:hypothetical protein
MRAPGGSDTARLRCGPLRLTGSVITARAGGPGACTRSRRSIHPVIIEEDFIPTGDAITELSVDVYGVTARFVQNRTLTLTETMCGYDP